MSRLVARLVSGGQAGVDRGALDAALRLGFPCGGWCPKGRKAEDGKIHPSYPLQETETDDYIERTKRNVEDADATLIITLTRKMTPGSAATAAAVKRLKSVPCMLHLDLQGDPDAAHVTKLLGWIRSVVETRGFLYPPPRPVVLNVAGTRESKAPGIQARTEGIIYGFLLGLA